MLKCQSQFRNSREFDQRQKWVAVSVKTGINKQTNFFHCENIWWKSIKMLNKRASAGQVSNDDFKHLIQVNARNLNLFASKFCMKCFPSKQAETLFWQSFCYLFSSGSVGVRQGLWPISHGYTKCHFLASLDVISFELTLNFLLSAFVSFPDLHGMGELLSRTAQIEAQSRRPIDGCAWWITAGRNNRSRHQL